MTPNCAHTGVRQFSPQQELPAPNAELQPSLVLPGACSSGKKGTIQTAHILGEQQAHNFQSPSGWKFWECDLELLLRGDTGSHGHTHRTSGPFCNHTVLRPSLHGNFLLRNPGYLCPCRRSRMLTDPSASPLTSPGRLGGGVSPSLFSVCKMRSWL